VVLRRGTERDPARERSLGELPALLTVEEIVVDGFSKRRSDTIDALGLEGELQVASFHPQYQFAGTDAHDMANATNRSPYPTLHLLREDSIDRAVEAFPEPEEIVDANLHTLEALGAEGWAALVEQCRIDATQTSEQLAQPEPSDQPEANASPKPL